VIGSIRRECLDHVIVWNERSLHRTFGATSLTITSGALTSRWTTMRPSRGPSHRQSVARSSRSHTSAVCLSTTNDGLPDRRSRPCLTWPYCQPARCRVFPQRLRGPQRRRNSCFGCTRPTRGDRGAPSVRGVRDVKERPGASRGWTYGAAAAHSVDDDAVEHRRVVLPATLSLRSRRQPPMRPLVK